MLIRCEILFPLEQSSPRTTYHPKETGHLLQLIRRILNRVKRAVGVHTPAEPSAAVPEYHFVSNVCDANHDRPAALMCYVVRPFVPNSGVNPVGHANFWRTQAIAKILAEQGYRVDVCDWRKPDPPSAAEYDLVVGLGRAFCETMRGVETKPRSVYLGTGTHPEQTNEACIARVNEINNRRGVELRTRLLDEDNGAEIADAIFVVGNEWVDGTYHARCETPTYRLWNSVVDGVPEAIQDKDWEQARRHYMWMAGYNPVRRRLDVLLEAFADMPEHHLWVLGEVSDERDFYAAYRNELENLPNVHYEGYTKINSEAFRDVAIKCGYFLYPSTSDGMAGSVVNTSYVGLVPLVTEQTGIDLGEHGCLIHDTSIEGIRRLIAEKSAIQPEDLARESRAVAEFIHENYTQQRFIESFQQALQDSGVVNGLN